MLSNHQTDSSIMAKLLKIAKTKDVPPGQAAPFTIEGQKIALFNVEGTYYAVGDTCTHRGGPLSEGDVQGTRVTCPWHGAEADKKLADDATCEPTSCASFSFGAAKMSYTLTTSSICGNGRFAF